MPSIYVINPAPVSPTYYTAEAYADAEGGWVQIADLAIVTVAAFAPQGWDVRVCDEAISPVDFDADADFIAITGKVSQRDRMVALSREFRGRGKTVLIGGPFASLSPAEMRPHADILVTGEIEEIGAKLFADLAQGCWQDRYEGGKADIRLSPTPRWDLYPVDRALFGAVQTTRGCPFNCEFCDVIQYQGRKQRHKTIEQVIAELDVLYQHGFRRVFIVDDNLTVHRQWARAVLDSIAAWNAGHGADRVSFMTQASVDIAREPDLLEKCREAGLTFLFVGVETINEESLRETGKRQNLLQPIQDALAKIVGAGIAVQAGMIVGFDHDSPDIFGRLLEFLQASPIMDANVGVLNAPEATDLYRRLQAAGRLSGPIWEAGAVGPFATNIVPERMTRDQLLAGTEALCQEIYSPAAYRQRMMNFIAAFGDHAPRQSAPASHRMRTGGRLFFRIMRSIASRGKMDADMLADVLREADRKPAVMPAVMQSLMQYDQTRYFLALERAQADAAASPQPQEADALRPPALALA